MDAKKVLELFMKEGMLLDQEALGLFSDEADLDSEAIEMLVRKLKQHTSSRVITKSVLQESRETAKEIFLDMPSEKQRKLQKLKIKLGLEIEISNEVSSEASRDVEETAMEEGIPVKILSKTPVLKKKIGVEDFTQTLRDRFVKLRAILQERSELDSLVSINRLSHSRKKASIIGMVSNKSITKNKNMVLEIEDLTGKIKVIVGNSKPELFEMAENIPLDGTIGVNGFGDKEVLFANSIVLPEAMIFERKKSPMDESVLFLGDLHYGSKLFLEDNFKRFIDYLNGKVPGTQSEVEKIKYMFICGDLVSGVGNYPGQQRDLKIEDLESQFQGLAEMLGKIKRNIKIIVSPGNHDGVRLMEPQPVIDEKYAWPLYNLKNVLLTGNPAFVNIGAYPEKGFNGFNVLSYHGFSYAYYMNTIPELLDTGFNTPEKAMAYLLQHRHLAPTYGSMQTLPLGEDLLAINKVPDIFISGHSHKCAVTYHNNVLIVSNACWEEETEYQKRKGNNPDFCKVPIFNLNSRQIKMLDFE